MSVLQRSTLAILERVRPRDPFFGNQVLAELFEAENTRGPLKLLPYAEGGYVLFDTRAPLNECVLGHFGSLELARRALAGQATEAA